MFRLLIAEFWSDLKIQRTRALLTMFAVFWGTLTIVLLLGFGEGFRLAVVEGALGGGDRVLIVYGGETSRNHNGLSAGRRVRLVEDDLDVLLAAIPELRMGSASYGAWGTVLESPHLTTTTMMEGVHPDFAYMRSMYHASGGRFLNERDLAERRRVAFLGDSVALRLFPAGDAVGSALHVDGVPFTVVGTMAPKPQMSMNNGPDADRVIIPATTMRTIYGRRHVGHVLVRPHNIQDAEVVKRRLYEVLGARHGFHADDARALRIWDYIEDERITRAIGLGIQIFLGVIGGLTLIVAGVGVANIMYVVVRERTREIGVKLAVGARRRHVMAQFVFEAVLICLAGGLAGLGLGAAIVGGVAAIPDVNMAMEIVGNPALPWPIVLITIGILLGIGILSGVFPARKAALVDPVESLRWE